MTILALLVIAAAIVAIYYRLEVRLTLFLAGLTLGAMAGDPMAIVRKFLATFSDEKFVVPICTAMGFAYVLRHTGCDQHLVHLLVRPLTKVRFLLLPGTVVVGFLVNMPVVSQTSTAVTIGPVVIPILLAARFSPLAIGAALLLGSSIGGELFNPGAPELRTTITESQKAAQQLQMEGQVFDSQRCIRRILPLNLLGLTVATGVLWTWAARRERTQARATDSDLNTVPVETDLSTKISADRRSNYVDAEANEARFVVNPLKALVPLLPLILLYLTGPPLHLLPVPVEWLEEIGNQLPPPGRFESRLIGAAMLVGTAIAALASPRRASGTARVFFEGAGYGFCHIISLIVAAACFGEGIKVVGLAEALGDVIKQMPDVLIPAAGLFSLGFATLSGSGMATTQALFPFFARPALEIGIDPIHVGAVVSLAAAAGRTLSPVAAVTLMTARLTDTDAFQLSKAVALPLLASTAAIILAAMLLAPGL
jgi:DcuC family C4-dicarboxylate transporter